MTVCGGRIRQNGTVGARRDAADKKQTLPHKKHGAAAFFFDFCTKTVVAFLFMIVAF